jgi:hypothetical protein
MNGLPARLAAFVGLLVLLLLPSAAPVLASCAMPVPIEQAMREADSVFVGTVTQVSNSGRWAIVAVEEVWAGPDLTRIVEVRGGAEGNAASSVDRTYANGGAYLFVVSVSNGTLNDNACSATTEMAPDLVALRPASARQPVDPAPEPGSDTSFDLGLLLPPAALVVATGLVVFGAALVLRKVR